MSGEKKTAREKREHVKENGGGKLVAKKTLRNGSPTKTEV